MYPSIWEEKEKRKNIEQIERESENGEEKVLK